MKNTMGLRGVTDYVTLTGGHYEPGALLFDLLLAERHTTTVAHCIMRMMQHVNEPGTGNTYHSIKDDNGPVLVTFDASVSC